MSKKQKRKGDRKMSRKQVDHIYQYTYKRVFKEYLHDRFQAEDPWYVVNLYNELDKIREEGE